jgi:hypothetical protein
MTKAALPTSPSSSADRKRYMTLSQLASQRGWRFVQDTTIRMLDGSSLYSLARHDWDYQNHIIGENWEYIKISFKARGQTGFSHLEKRKITYAVMYTGLPRKLPNVVFDSIDHQRKDFRIVFDRGQRMQLEGNFNKYFVTYFGYGYTIDDLSFITPEVMEALIDAREYNVEIVHDSLLLFSQVQSDPEAQILAMSNAIQIIRKKLLNNIVAYRDDRVPPDQSMLIVARAGMFLKRRYVGSVFFKIIFALLYLIVIVIILDVLLSSLKH